MRTGYLHVTNKIYCRICSRRRYGRSLSNGNNEHLVWKPVPAVLNLQDFIIRSHWVDESEMTDIFYIYLKSEVSILFQLGFGCRPSLTPECIQSKWKSASHTHVAQMMIDSRKMSHKFYLPLNGIGNSSSRRCDIYTNEIVEVDGWIYSTNIVGPMEISLTEEFYFRIFQHRIQTTSCVAMENRFT